MHRPLSFKVRAAALAGLGLATACVKDAPEGPRRVVVANWSFPPVRPNPAVRMWPKEAASPDRKKHSVVTSPQGTALAVKVEGGDPYLTWDFASELPLHSVRLAIRATHDGPIELFWGSLQCPVYSQKCSMVAHAPQGASTLALFMDPTQKVRSIRVDILDVVGETVFFEGVDAFDSPELDVPWLANAGQSTAESTGAGLVIQASGNDPWIAVSTQGLTAERITAVELTMPEAPTQDGLPQVYWQGSCGPFSETCAKSIARSNAKGITHRVELRPGDGWRGDVKTLRLDPGSTPGRYVIRKISLIHGPPP